MQAVHHPHHQLLLPRHSPLFINLHSPAATSAVHSHGGRRRVSIISASTKDQMPDPTSATAAFNDYQLLFSSQPTESINPVTLPAVEGALPADFPVGTYYLIGPGMTSDGYGSTVNPLDGHGYLRAFRFDGSGTVTYTARYVETEAAREEREDGTGKWRFRRPGLFSMLKVREAGADWSLPKNVGNTTVLSWGGRLFCLWDVGHPYEIDPTTLETVGPADLIGAAEKIRWSRDGRGEFTSRIAKYLPHGILMLLRRTLSHYKIDAIRNRLLVLSCGLDGMFLPSSTFTFYEFDSNFELKQKREFLISDQLTIHDWAFTDSHYILTANRIKLNMPGIVTHMSGLAPVISTISLNPSRSTTPIYLLPRFSDNKDEARDWRVPVEAPSQLWISHVVNAFEEKDDSGGTEIKIQAVACSYQWFNFTKLFGYDWQSEKLDPSFMNAEKKELPHLVQISIMLNEKGTCCWCTIVNSGSRWNKPTDFPIINPLTSGKRNRFAYACATSGSRKLLPHFPFDSVIKLDCSNDSVESWQPGSRSFIGEPMFVSKWTIDDEEDGYIVVIEYAVLKQRCYLVVLDAKRVGREDAVIAKMEVPPHLRFPFGFHGLWDGK